MARTDYGDLAQALRALRQAANLLVLNIDAGREYGTRYSAGIEAARDAVADTLLEISAALGGGPTPPTGARDAELRVRVAP